MAAPTYATDLQDIDDGSGTFTEPTGALLGTLSNADTDNFIQGTSCVTKTTGASGAPALAGIGILDGAAATITSPAAYYAWVFVGAGALINTLANGGIRLIVGNTSANYKMWYVHGSDTFPYIGWTCVAVDPNVTADATQGTPTATLQYFGAVFNCSINIGKGNPMGLDALRYGRTLTVTNGSVADGLGTFLGAATQNDSINNRWGQLQAIPGGYQLQGQLLLGTAGTAVDFRDANTSVVIAPNAKVTAAFNEIEIRNASSRVDFTAVTFTALGSVARGNFLVTHNADVNIDACSFTGMGTFSLLAATSFTDCTLRSCDTITANGAVLTGTGVRTPRVATDESALLWNVADGDPDGNLDGMSFSKGTNDHHAISLTPNAATTNVTLRDIVFTGFGADNTNSSVLELEDRGADTTWNINLVGFGSITYKKRRGTDTVNIIANPVTLTVTVLALADFSPISGARVYVTAGAGGPLSEGTVIINDVTDGAGEVPDTRTLASDQPITGWVRKAGTVSPFYKEGAISGIFSATTGADVTVLLPRDE